MYARLYSARAKDGKLDEMIRVWSEEDIPLMGSVRGYRGACLLTDRESGRGISITLWDSEEDSEADEKSDLHQEQLGMFADILAEEPVRAGYEISACDRISL